MIKIQNEVISLLENHSQLNNTQRIAEIDLRLKKLVKTTYLGEWNQDFINRLDKDFFKNPQFRASTIKFWAIYKQLDDYTRAEAVEKPQLSEALREQLSQLRLKSFLIYHKIWDKHLIKSVYLSKCSELVQLIYDELPIPSLSLFDQNNQPALLIERESQRESLLSAFKARNAQDNQVEDKIIYVQRHIRACIRQKSEIERIGDLYFASCEKNEKMQRAMDLIQDANTPYKPQKCCPELANRIVQAASKLKLFSSVTHLLDPNNIADMLDDCIYARENLIDFYKKFRPASLLEVDIKNGDRRVICFGPDKIDLKCLKGRTVGLKVDLDQLIDPTKPYQTPNFFFKQCDLQYDIGENLCVNIKGTPFIFSLSRENPDGLDPRCTDFQLYKKKNNLCSDYYARVKKDSLISSNIQEMHKILILNFFRFLDLLDDHITDAQQKTQAQNKRNEIYDKIDKLDQAELHDFLLDLGRKISCSSEFNIFGAYKIAPQALRSISIYEGRRKVDVIEIEEVCQQLNNQNFEYLNELKEQVPELFNSYRFMSFLKEKITDPIVREKIS